MKSIDKAIRACDEEHYFYYEGDYKKPSSAEEAISEAQRLLEISKKHDGKEKTYSFGFIAGDIARMELIKGIWTASPKANTLLKDLKRIKSEASTIAKRNRP